MHEHERKHECEHDRQREHEHECEHQHEREHQCEHKHEHGLNVDMRQSSGNYYACLLFEGGPGVETFNPMPADVQLLYSCFNGRLHNTVQCNITIMIISDHKNKYVLIDIIKLINY